MRWALLFVGVLGTALYALGSFIPPPDKPSGSSESAVLVWPDDAQRDVRPGLPTHAIDPFAASPDEKAPNVALQEQPTGSQTSEPQESLQDDLGTSNAAMPADISEQDSWGELVRGAPIHAGPSVSSDILGYAAAGTETQLLERKLGWARILDPATSREGWIYEKHISVKAGPSTLGLPDDRQEAALESDPDPGEVEQVKRSVKAKQSRKTYAKKLWRKRLRFGFRFRR